MTTESDPSSPLQQTELAIKQVELELKRRELSSPTSALSKLRIAPAEATVLVGALAFLGTFTATFVQEGNKLALKQREQESSLILDAMKGDDPTRNLARLTLLIDAGFVSDKNGTIRALILSGKYGDAISAPSSPKLIDALAKGSVPELLREVLTAAGATPDIDLQEQANFQGIAAVAVQPGKRVALLYDKVRIRGFDKKTSNSWTVPAILAHEIGHVLLGHMDQGASRCFQVASGPISSDCGTTRSLELQADEFAGRILRRLGASLDQAQKALEFLPEQASWGYPARKERIDAVLKGWRG